MMYAGKNIVVSPALTDQPIFELSPKMRAILGPAYVEKFNQWSAEFFGVEQRAYSHGDVIYMSPATYAAFQKIVATRPGWEP